MQRFGMMLSAIAVVTAACSIPVLSDADIVWCTDNYAAVLDAGEALDLSPFAQGWAESQGVEYDADGAPIPSKEYDAFLELVLELGIGLWLNTRDGVRSCEAALESR
jgi:hypothetical protein